MPEGAAPSDIVVTGLGLLTPLGASLGETIASLADRAAARRAGRGLDWLPPAAWSSGPLQWPAAPQRCGAGRVELPEGDGPRLLRLARLALGEAWRDARLDPTFPEGTAIESDRIGLVWGLSKLDLTEAARASRAASTGCPPEEGCHEGLFDEPMLWLPPVLSSCWDESEAPPPVRVLPRGPSTCVVAACASGLVAAIRAAQWLERGWCDCAVALCADASIHPGAWHSFERLGVLARPDRQHATPDVMIRPFAADRTGFLPGEGAAALVFERAATAAARHVVPYARWLGGYELSDATGLTQIDPHGAALAHLLRLAAEGTGRLPDVLHLHGTATEANDGAELTAWRRFRSAAIATGSRSAVPAEAQRAVALKGALGHLLGASGGVELALAAWGLRQQQWLPSWNAPAETDQRTLAFADRLQPLEHQTAWKLSLGFGGHLALGALGALARDEQRPADVALDRSTGGAGGPVT